MTRCTWADVAAPGTRVLLVVNSAATLEREIERIVSRLEAVVGLDAVYTIAPKSLRRPLIRRGMVSRQVKAAVTAGLEVELGHFLEMPDAIRWAIGCEPAFVVGSEPYAPDNSEVKSAFEEQVAPIIGAGRFIVHSLPNETVFALTAEQLWARAARAETLAAYDAAMAEALRELQAAWHRAGCLNRPGDATARGEVQGALDGLVGGRSQKESAATVAARTRSVIRLHAAIRAADTVARAQPRLWVEPTGSPVLPEAVGPINGPSQRSDGARCRGTRLVFRGEAQGPYHPLLISRPRWLEAGDAVVAEGTVHEGGVTVGLIRDGQWASRVDVDETGRFVAVAAARAAGEHTLVIAHCLKSGQRRNAIALRRFGWALRERVFADSAPERAREILAQVREISSLNDEIASLNDRLSRLQRAFDTTPSERLKRVFRRMTGRT
jgi:hypothetical protein